MTHTPKRIEDVRQAFLVAFSDPQSSAQLLRDLLGQAHAQTPELFVPHKADSAHTHIDADKLKWNAVYLSQHKTIAPYNFSRERLEHMVEVLDQLQKNGHKNFTVPVTTTPIGVTGATQAQHMNAHYSPSTNLKKFVAQGDLLTIRTALRLELNDNRLSSQALRAALAWTIANTPGLCEAFSEKAFARGLNTDRTQWTAEYYGDQVVYLKTNFAQERFEHLIEVREHLRGLKIEGFEPVDAPAPGAVARHPAAASSEQQRPDPQPRHTSPNATRQELSPAFKNALLIGGALAAVVILLVTLVR